MKYVTAIVLAAGKGVRFKSKISKPLSEINAKPVIIHCLGAFGRHPYIRDIVVVANPSNIKKITGKIKQYRIGKVSRIVLGGRQRQDSVYCGLKAIAPRTGLVLIHDGVRPFVDKRTISLAIKEAGKYGAAIAGVPVKATIKRVNGKGTVSRTIDRDGLWEIQTPQVFKKSLILRAYREFGNTNVTDDASLVEKLGVPVKMVMGSYFNIKVTTPEDIAFAKAIKINKG